MELVVRLNVVVLGIGSSRRRRWEELHAVLKTSPTDRLPLHTFGRALGAAWVTSFHGIAVKDRAMHAKFEEVRQGMTLSEVESLMGREYDGQNGGGTNWDKTTGGIHVKGWDGPGTLTVDVLLNEQDKVVDKHLHPTQPTPWEILRAHICYWLSL